MNNKNIKVLLIDDEDDFRQLMKFWLESKGYSVLAASNGADGIELVKNDQPNIIFLDLRMPVMDGVATLKEIRTFDRDLPVIVISAFLDDPRAKEAMAFGISGVFNKAKNFDEGLTILEVALRRHKSLKRDPE
ncbi:response regulator [PVC group bacterium]|nr:response regulator [PVC group bacterium]MCH7590234.1 response regulator [PVC group bacterium]